MSMFRWLRNRRARTRRSGQRPSARCRPQLEVLEDRCLLAGGVLDPAFGNGGSVVSPLDYSTYPMSATTYPQAGTVNDGKIIVGGEEVNRGLKERFKIARYNMDGSLDKTFGGSGEVLGPAGRARAVLVQLDGKVLAAGESNIVRLNADGSLDTTFGSHGLVTTTFTAKGFDEIWAMVLQPDGKIVVAAGTSPPNSNTRQLALARYNANGSLDTSFGTGGKALDHIPTSVLEGGGTAAIGLAIDPTGQLFVEMANPESNPYPAMIVRYTNTGMLDKSFGGSGTGYETFDGKGLLPSLASGGAVGIQPSNGDIIVLGITPYPYCEGLARLKPDGTLDGGITSANNTKTGVGGGVFSVQFQANGGILVGSNAGSGLGVTRYNPDLSLDTFFGTAGVAEFSPPQSEDSFCGMGLEPDGRIVVAGLFNNSSLDQVAVARFLSTVPQITAFSANPSPVKAGSSVALTASNIIDPTPSASITQVAFYLDSNNDGILEPATDTLLGYATQTSPGVWTYTFPVTQASGSYTLFAQAVDSYGVIGDPLALTLQVL